jgi:hypothetical protein
MTHTSTPDWQQLVRSNPWQRLTTQQKVWTSAFIANGGSTSSATMKAYPRAKKSSVPAMSWELLKNPRIRAVLDFWAGKDDRVRMVEIVRKQLDAAEPGSVSASRLTQQLERLLLGAPEAGRRPGEPKKESDSQRFKVGDVVEQDGKRYRIEAVEVQ